MAAPKVRIPIELPAGDMSGAEEAKREIAEVKQDATAAASEIEGIGTSTGKVGDALDDIGKSGAGFDKLFNQQRLQGIGEELRKIAFTLGDVGRQFADTDAGKEMFSGLSEEAKVFGTTASTILSDAAQGFAAGGPIGLGIGTLNGLIKTVAGSFIESNERIKTAERELEAAQVAHAARQRQRKIDAATSEVEDRIESETLAIQRQTAALERNQQVRAAAAGLADAQGDQADQQALAGGAAPALVAAGAAERELQAKLTELENRLIDRITQTNSAVEAARNAQDDLEKLVEQNRETGGLADEIKEAEKDAATKLEEAVRATADTDALEQTIATQKQELITRTSTEVQGLASDTEEALTTEVDKAITAIEGKAAEQGGKLSGLAGDALQGLYEVVRDSIPDSQQTARIETLLGNFKNSSEGRDQKIIGGIEGILKAIRSRDAEFDRLVNQVADLNRRVGTL